jgi:tRNA A-37 threonylcarbamoyl transferase component Bud32
MAFIEINPDYRTVLERHGLVSAAAILALPGVIVCGHPDRHVVRVQIGAIPAILKREHRTRWKDRLHNAWAGFGLISKSYREWKTLLALEPAAVGCPERIAVGEDDEGRAFLLLRTASNAVDLRVYLHSRQAMPPRARRRFALRLGAALARMHNAGFDHPDLYSKHVLVNLADQSFCFLDWQRSRSAHPVSWQERWRDLAALDATLGDQLITVSERLACLRAYLRESRRSAAMPEAKVLRCAFEIHRREQQLLKQRRVREDRQPPLTTGAQSLVWRDGEALCVTPALEACLAGQTPDWLLLGKLPAQPAALLLRDTICLPSGQEAILVRRRATSYLRGFWNWLRRRPGRSPELRQSSLLFRLQRAGVAVPRLLAFGQRQVVPWRVESFLLTDKPAHTVSLLGWLADQSRFVASAHEQALRWVVIRQAGQMLRRMHDANCYLAAGWVGTLTPATGDSLILLQFTPGRQPRVLLSDVERLRSQRHAGGKVVLRELAALQHDLTPLAMGRTDSLRFLLSYLGTDRLLPAGKRLARAVQTLDGHLSRKHPSRAVTPTRQSHDSSLRGAAA